MFEGAGPASVEDCVPPAADDETSAEDGEPPPEEGDEQAVSAVIVAMTVIAASHGVLRMTRSFRVTSATTVKPRCPVTRTRSPTSGCK